MEDWQLFDQMPATSIQELQQSIDWSESNADDQVNQLLQRTALQFLTAYQHDRNKMLGAYNDKRDETATPKLSQPVCPNSTTTSSPIRTGTNKCGRYVLLGEVKFGLKPIVPIVQVTLRGKPGYDLAYAIAEKQLYFSQYFQTALDLSFCVRGSDEQEPGFYLVAALGSEQAGLTGLNGSIVRKVAVGRSVSNLKSVLTDIRQTLEANN
jgi:hypothetical protein